jgi:hypothetical protein
VALLDGTVFTDPLKRVRVSVPCAAEWERMRGDERVRFCERCELNVYNLSALTRREAEALVTRTEGRLCVRFYRRADGTIITRNCPTGLARLKRRVSRAASAAAAAGFGLFAGVGVAPESKVIGSLDSPAAAASSEQAARAVAGEPVAWEPVAAGEEAEAFEVMGTSSGPPASVTILSLGVLGGVAALFGYPLMKIKAWRDEKRRARLSIWRKD